MKERHAGLLKRISELLLPSIPKSLKSNETFRQLKKRRNDISQFPYTPSILEYFTANYSAPINNFLSIFTLKQIPAWIDSQTPPDLMLSALQHVTQHEELVSGAITLVVERSLQYIYIYIYIRQSNALFKLLRFLLK